MHGQRQMAVGTHGQTALAQGRGLWEELYSRKEVLATCEKVGIKPGFFSIDAGAGKHTYILRESGDVINVDNEYAIDSSGHIHVSEDDTFTSTEVKYPKRAM